jgi:hypothetical protein
LERVETVTVTVYLEILRESLRVFVGWDDDVLIELQDKAPRELVII